MLSLFKIFDALIVDLDGHKINDNSIPDSKIIDLDGSKLHDYSVSPSKLIQGEGSGLNADTVDGIQGSQIARVDVSNTFQQPQTFQAVRTHITGFDGSGNHWIRYSTDSDTDLILAIHRNGENDYSLRLKNGGSDSYIWHDNAVIPTVYGNYDFKVEFPNGMFLRMFKTSVEPDSYGKVEYDLTQHGFSKVYFANVVCAEADYPYHIQLYSVWTTIEFYVFNVSDGSKKTSGAFDVGITAFGE